MKTRLDDMVDTRFMWIMTFHAMCTRLMRYFADDVKEFDAGFTIYAEDEKNHVIKRILDDMKLDADDYAKPVKNALSEWKNDILSLDEYMTNEYAGEDAALIESIMKKYPGGACQKQRHGF